MTLLPRTLRLDASDGVVFPRAAEPGEWAVPGGFCFWDDDDSLAGKRRQAFRAGFLGLGSFGWSTLVEVAGATAAARTAALAALAGHLQATQGAPEDGAAAAAEDEIAFAESLCAGHPPGTVLALERRFEGGEMRERFRTLHRRDTPHSDFGALPVFAIVEADEDAPQRPDLAALALPAKPAPPGGAGAPSAEPAK